MVEYKTHLRNPKWHPKSIKSIMLCGNSGYADQYLTDKIEEVTCQKCLNKASKLNIKELIK